MTVGQSREANRYPSSENSALKSSPVVEDEMKMKSDSRSSMSVFWLTHRQTEDEDRESSDCAGDAFIETFVFSVTHCGSHAQPANTVKL